jgi:hypothetical protein
MTSKLKKVTYTSLIGLGLFAGAAGIAAAGSGSGTTPKPASPAVVTPAAGLHRATAPKAAVAPKAEAPDTETRSADETPDAADNPDANETPDAAEAPGAAETKDANEPAGDSGINCENGIDTATRAECDGGPAANQDNDPNESADGDNPNG